MLSSSKITGVRPQSLRYPKKFYEALPEFDRPETASLPLPRLYLQAKQLSSDLASGGVS